MQTHYTLLAEWFGRCCFFILCWITVLLFIYQLLLAWIFIVAVFLIEHMIALLRLFVQRFELFFRFPKWHILLFIQVSVRLSVAVNYLPFFLFFLQVLTVIVPVQSVIKAQFLRVVILSWSCHGGLNFNVGIVVCHIEFWLGLVFRLVYHHVVEGVCLLEGRSWLLEFWSGLNLLLVRLFLIHSLSVAWTSLPFLERPLLIRCVWGYLRHEAFLLAYYWLTLNQFFEVIWPFAFVDFYILLVLEEIRVLQLLEYGLKLLSLGVRWLLGVCRQVHLSIGRLSCSPFQSCSRQLFLFSSVICGLALRSLNQYVLILIRLEAGGCVDWSVAWLNRLFSAFDHRLALFSGNWAFTERFLTVAVSGRFGSTADFLPLIFLRRLAWLVLD